MKQGPINWSLFHFMDLEKERIKNPLMEFYRHVYSFSAKWNGKDSLKNKTVCVYCEQGFGDIIQFLRYIKPLKERGCKVILHIPEVLHPLLSGVEGVDDYFDKQSSILPKHDFHILSLSLPFLLEIEEIPTEPYIKYAITADMSCSELPIKTNIGITWEGSPEHPKNTDRCCPLKYFNILDEANLFMLQKGMHLNELTRDVGFDIFSIPINNFGDTASLINAMDFIVTVDTAVLHLAGAMGKKAYGLLGTDPDPRWEVSKWYNNVILLRGEWEQLFHYIKEQEWN